MIYSQLSYIVGTILSKMEAKARNFLTREEIKLILANHEEGKSYSEIVGIVRRSKSVVYRVNSRFKADKTLEPKLRTGRPSMTTKREERMMPIFIKNFFTSMLFLIYAKGQLKLQYLCKTNRLAIKLKLC